MYAKIKMNDTTFLLDISNWATTITDGIYQDDSSTGKAALSSAVNDL